MTCSAGHFLNNTLYQYNCFLNRKPHIPNNTPIVLNRSLLKTKSDWLWNINLLFSLSRFLFSLSHFWSCYDEAKSTRTQKNYSSFLNKSSLNGVSNTSW